jgi:phosphate starvation-inducible PhoH-like protein
MGSKNAFKKQSKHNNVLKINQYQIEKQKDVQIIPRNKNQESYLIKLLDPNKDIVFGVGPAGTGKTLLAVQVAIKMFKQRQVDRIIITRPAVSVDEDIGFLPGTLEEKMAPWTRPIFDVFQEYFRTEDLRSMMYEGVIEIAP